RRAKSFLRGCVVSESTRDTSLDKRERDIEPVHVKSIRDSGQSAFGQSWIALAQGKVNPRFTPVLGHRWVSVDQCRTCFVQRLWISSPLKIKQSSKHPGSAILRVQRLGA